MTTWVNLPKVQIGGVYDDLKKISNTIQKVHV